MRDIEEYRNFCDRSKTQRPQPEEVVGVSISCQGHAWNLTPFLTLRIMYLWNPQLGLVFARKGLIESELTLDALVIFHSEGLPLAIGRAKLLHRSSSDRDQCQ